MKAKIITDNSSLLLGFRLGGIVGDLITDMEKVSTDFKEISKQEDLALIIISKNCYMKIEDDVEAFRQQNSTPLVVVLD